VQWSPPTRCTPNATTPAFLVDRGAEGLLVVKATSRVCTLSSPGCRGGRSRSWTAPATMATGASRTAPLKVAAVAGLCFPHAAQAIQVIRRVRAPGSHRWRTVTPYAGTTLGTASPAQLAGWPAGYADTGGSRTGCTGSAT
jgi:hypothetical protein